MHKITVKVSKLPPAPKPTLPYRTPLGYNPRLTSKERGSSKVSKAEHRRRLQKKLDTWTDGQRQLLIELYSEGLSYADMVSLVDHPRSTIYSEIRRLCREGILTPREERPKSSSSSDRSSAHPTDSSPDDDPE